MAISFNALKNGCLSYIDISNCNFDCDDFNNLIKSMYISEDDHNNWYGFQFDSYIQKETPKFYKKTFHCNLETFIFNGNELYLDIDYLDPRNSNIENLMKTFLSKSTKLNTLVLNKNKFNNNFLNSISDLNKKII